MVDNLPSQRTVISDDDCIRTVLRQPEADDIERVQCRRFIVPTLHLADHGEIVTAFRSDTPNCCRILHMILRPEFQMDRFCVIRILHQFFI